MCRVGGYVVSVMSGQPLSDPAVAGAVGLEGSPEAPGWSMTPSPSPCYQIPLQVLPSRDEDRLDVDAAQSP